MSPITRQFCTYQDSTAVLVCAKLPCDSIRHLQITGMAIYDELGILTKQH